ncbi:MAG: MotA/TolQ/ExbB proton channel family protein [Oligoflexales bacterium]
MSPIIAVCGIFFSLYYVLTHPHGTFTGYFDKSALVLIGLMPPSVLLLSHTIKDFLNGIATLLRALFRTQNRAHNEVIEILTKSSALVRTQGIGSLMNVRNHIRYELLRDGISLIVNDFTVEEIRHNLSNKINAKQSRMSLSANLFENMAKASPAVGLIGTLMGLISMMSNLQDPTKIGGGMALAMITTLYGLLLGTLLYAPCGEKISLEAEKSLEIDLMVLEGVIGLKSKKSSIHMKDIMKTFGSKNKGGDEPAARRQQG